MSKWLSPQKMLDYHIVRRFGDVAEAERQLYLAVVRGDVRARLNGKTALSMARRDSQRLARARPPMWIVIWPTDNHRKFMK